MKVGLLTAPFGRESLDVVITFAAEAGFDALEVTATPGSQHIDPSRVSSDEAKRIAEGVRSKGLEISSLACYMNMTDPDPSKRKQVVDHLIATIDTAAATGVDVVCAMAGMPVPGKDKMKTIEEDVREVYPPILRHAEEKGIKIALENWYATNIQNLAHWERIFEVVPSKNFGLNFDPSHLLWQGIDYLYAVERFADRIFHTHAKDCEIKEHTLRRLGNQASGWWRYVIPGFGKIHWGEYTAALRANGYNGVMSIEHEDGALGREEGFMKGLQHLRQFA
ncbi:MAG: sugar phosphate isomerase/epimerase [Candidatus Latescibacteria bacterium]|nr:sugar phosphate isomerase/epimerase [Candidatus Latescibacterota bacterium]